MSDMANGAILPMNGEAPKERPKRSKRQPKAVKADTAKETTPLPQECIYAKRGRVAADLIAEDARFLFQPWLPLSLLTLVAGEPNTGKSTFFAWVASLPGRTIILPGEEEKPELMLIPRLKAAGCDLQGVKILDDHPYVFPRDKKLVAAVAKEWKADRIIVDPLDSYMEDGASENDGQVVRPFLESLGWIAHELGAAVVGARHPGKEPGNILPGSRQWRTVPRQVIELVLLPSTPKKRIIRLEKDGIRSVAQPTYFHLDTTAGKALKFRFGEKVDEATQAMAKEVDGPGRRWAVQLAGQLIRELFHDTEEPTIEELNARARDKGVGQNALDEAKRLLGIEAKPREKQGKWFMERESKEWPEWCKKPQY